MSKWKLILLLMAVGLGSGVFWAYQQYYQTLNTKLTFNQPTLYELKRGQNLHHLLVYLEDEAGLPESWPVKLLVRFEPTLAELKAGTYELSPGMNVQQVLLLLASGKEKLFEIRLVEGFRWRDWQGQMQAHPHLLSAQLTELEAQLKPEGGSLEGWLMPDTYHFTRGMQASVLVKRAYLEMQKFLLEQWPKRKPDLPYASPYEALIMASIVEKETGLAEERPRIAAVFVNRLRKNMRLQTDPTVIYGMGDAFDGDIRRQDLRTATPYNTYVIKGLPPTPIAMVSRDALMAALHPIDSEELYFVSRNDGSHVFSTNLADHNAAVRQYQLKK
nr:endolytic transglycosylase MltG [Bowmanella yangjiangensis]